LRARAISAAVNNTTKPTGLRRNVCIINCRRHAEVSVLITRVIRRSSAHTHTHTHISNSLLIRIHISLPALPRSKCSCGLCTIIAAAEVLRTNSLHRSAERYYPSSILDAPLLRISRTRAGRQNVGRAPPDSPGMPPTGFSRKIQFRRPIPVTVKRTRGPLAGRLL